MQNTTNIIKPKVYLAGGMTKFGREKYDEGNEWRVRLQEEVEKQTDYFQFINPNNHFKFWEAEECEPVEVMRFDLNIVRNSNIIVVNFNDPASIGTQSELAIAYEHRKPILGLNLQSDTNENLHPWQRAMCDKIFHDIHELANYLIFHFSWL